MARYNLECIVLRSINYKDTDRIYTLFSRSQGKVSAVAKGVRRISSKRSGNLDTLNHVSIAINETTGAHKTLNEVKTINSFRNLKKSLDRSAKGFYVGEVLHRFTEENHENGELFDLVLATLTNLNNLEIDSASTLGHFEILLMENLGYGMSLTKCANCGRPFSTEWNEVKFNYALGGITCDLCKSGFTISRETAENLYNLAQPNFSALKLRDAAAVNEIIKPYVEDVLEDRVKTSSYFKLVL